MDKKCKRCGEAKPAGDYSPDKRAKDGLQSSCKVCVNELRRARYHKDPEIARAKRRQYARKNKARIAEINARSQVKNREKVLAGKRKYYNKIKDSPEFKAKQSEYIKNNKSKKREYDRQRRESPEVKNAALERALRWARENPDRRKIIVKAYDGRRRSAKKGGVSAVILAKWIFEQDMNCYWCGSDCKADYHIDHYVPLSKGGAHELDNLVIACPQCNLRKGASDPKEFAKTITKYIEGSK